MLVSSVPLSETQAIGLLRSAMIASSSRPNPKPRERGIGDERQAFAGEVVEDGEDSKRPGIVQLITQEIQLPTLVRALRQRQGRSRAQRSLAAAATTTRMRSST